MDYSQRQSIIDMLPWGNDISNIVVGYLKFIGEIKWAPQITELTTEPYHLEFFGDILALYYNRPVKLLQIYNMFVPMFSHPISVRDGRQIIIRGLSQQHDEALLIAITQPRIIINRIYISRICHDKQSEECVLCPSDDLSGIIHVFATEHKINSIQADRIVAYCTYRKIYIYNMKHSNSELVETVQLRNPIVFFHILPSGLVIAQDNIRADVGLLMLDLHHTSFYTTGDFKHPRKKFRAESPIHIMTCLEKLIELQDGRIFCFGANNPVATMFAIRPAESGNPAECGIPWTRELAFGDYPYLRWQKKEWDDAHEAMTNYEITYYPTKFDFEAKIIDIAEWEPYILCVIYGDIMGMPTYMLAVIDPGTADNPKLSVLRCENLGSDKVAIGDHIAKWKNGTLYKLC